MKDQTKKRGPGAPLRNDEGTGHIDLTLSLSSIAFLRSMKAGTRSRFVDDLIKQAMNDKAPP